MAEPGRDPRDWISHRRLHGQLLRGAAPPQADRVVAHLTAMQAQEHAYARWSVAQRMTGQPAAPAVDAAFDDGRFLRTHVLRPTWHYVAATDLRWLLRLSGPRVAAGNARRYRDLGLDDRTLSRSATVIAEAVAGAPRTRRELAAILDGQGICASGQRIAHLLMHAELTAVICSGPMRGKQHTYAAFDARVPADPGPDGDDALAELAWRYFSTRGPATVRDFCWWSGLSARDARHGLDLAQPRLTRLDVGQRAFWFAERGDRQPAQPRIDLVQCYDEMLIAYSHSRDVLQTASVAFPVPGYRSGFRHVLLTEGRLLGHWRPAPRGQVEIRAARQLDDGEQAALARATEAYRRFAQAATAPG